MMTGIVNVNDYAEGNVCRSEFLVSSFAKQGDKSFSPLSHSCVIFECEVKNSGMLM